jgi:hypothetical protein
MLSWTISGRLSVCHWPVGLIGFAIDFSQLTISILRSVIQSPSSFVEVLNYGSVILLTNDLFKVAMLVNALKSANIPTGITSFGLQGSTCYGVERPTAAISLSVRDVIYWNRFNMLNLYLPYSSVLRRPRRWISHQWIIQTDHKM